jgi:DNA-binding CsgD family transcriptional regulator
VLDLKLLRNWAPKPEETGSKRGRPRKSVNDLLGNIPRHGMELGRRELQVLKMHAELGMTQMSIAQTLGIDIKTVEHFAKRVRVKLGAANLAHAYVIYQVKAGVLTSDNRIDAPLPQ